MARLPRIGEDKWGEVLNNYLSIEHNSDGTHKTMGFNRGGTGATNVADARTNLGIASTIPLFIQPSNPSFSGQHLWVQTGLGSSGSGLTFWIEDGQ